MKPVDDKIVGFFAGHVVSEISFRKKNKIATLDTKPLSGSNFSQATS